MRIAVESVKSPIDVSPSTQSDNGWFQWTEEGVEVSLKFVCPNTCPESLKDLSAGVIHDGIFEVSGSVARYFLEREKEQCQREKASQHVYFIQAVNGGPIKIGIAMDVETRLNELQVASPYPLRVLKVMRNAGRRTEKELHARYADDRLCGEWFIESESLRGVINDSRD
jgi:hypothetical protein